MFVLFLIDFHSQGMFYVQSLILIKVNEAFYCLTLEIIINQ